MFSRRLVLIPLVFFSLSLYSQSLLDTRPDITEPVGNSGVSWSLGGYSRAVSFVSFGEDFKDPYLQSIYAETSVQLTGKAGKFAASYAEVRLRGGWEWEKEFTQWDLREAYVDLYLGMFDFRAGKQIIKWGKGTFYNPEGWLTPLDPTVRSPEEDDMRMGNWALKGSFHPWRPINISAIWLPVYRPSRLLTSLIAIPEEVSFGTADYPGVKLESSSYAVKADFRTRLMDFSAGWYEGYHHWPGLAFDSLFISQQTYLPSGAEITERAYKIRAAGADLAIPAGSWVIRAEGAYMEGKDDPQPGWVPFPELSYTGEIERTGEVFTFLAGYYGKWIPDFTEPSGDPTLLAGGDLLSLLGSLPQPLSYESVSGAISEQITLFNRLYNYQMKEFYHRAFIALRFDLFHGVLKADLPFIMDFTTEEYVLRPAVELVPYDGISLKAGYSLYDGPENSLYSLIGQKLSGPWLSLKVSF
ncbi:MAG: hypothetical protein ACOYXB_14015 [Bacteroidota bacterium]